MRFVEHPFTQLCSPCGEHVNGEPDFVAPSIFAKTPCVRCGATIRMPTQARVSPKIFSPKEESQ